MAIGRPDDLTTRRSRDGELYQRAVQMSFGKTTNGFVQKHNSMPTLQGWGWSP
ncbi:protein of unknown function [Pararobbsia alpina]